MRFRTFLRETFAANGVTPYMLTASGPLQKVLTSLSGMFINYTDEEGDKYKISGTTTGSATGAILVDSNTTAITVTPASFSGYTGQTYQIAVVNQSGDNVITECSFSGTTNKVTVTAGGLMTLYGTGAATTGNTGAVTVYHVDPVTSATLTKTVNTQSWILSGTLTVSSASGTTTGQTIALTVVNQNGIDVKPQCTWTIYSDTDNILTSVNAATGAIILNGTRGTAMVQATHIGGAYARGTVSKTTV